MKLEIKSLCWIGFACLLCVGLWLWWAFSGSSPVDKPNGSGAATLHSNNFPTKPPLSSHAIIAQKPDNSDIVKIEEQLKSSRKSLPGSMPERGNSHAPLMRIEGGSKIPITPSQVPASFKKPKVSPEAVRQATESKVVQPSLTKSTAKKLQEEEDTTLGEDNAQLREMWLPHMVAAAAKLGIALPMPPESARLNKVHVSRQEILGTDEFQICAGCMEWVIGIEEKSGRIVNYLNGELAVKINDEYQRIERNEFDKVEYSKPRISVEQAKKKLEAVGLPASLGWDMPSLGFGQPNTSFISNPSMRGWQFEYQRTYRGYPMWNDRILIRVEDHSGEIVFCDVSISSAIPPEPDVKIKGPALESIIDSILANPPSGGRFSLRGCLKRPNTFAVKGLGYMRANQIWHKNLTVFDQFKLPIRFVYNCVFKGDQGNNPYKYQFLIDAATGELVGGDYSQNLDPQ